MTIPDPRRRPTLSVEEAGRFCGLGRSAAYAAVERGELPVIRFGRRLVVPTAALRRLLQITPTENELPIRDDASGGQPEANVISIRGGSPREHESTVPTG